MSENDSDSTNSQLVTMFTAKSEGGLGWMNSHSMYNVQHLSFSLLALDSDDDQVKETKPLSLSLQIVKREAQEASTEDENSLADYQTNDNGWVVKYSKVN